VAQRREQVELEAAERHASAKDDTDRLIKTAEDHAAEAEKRVAVALQQAEKVRAESDQYVKDLVAESRRTADRIVAEARAFADQTVSDARAESEAHRGAAQRQFEDLSRKQESINTYLDELRGLLGSEKDGGTPVATLAVPAPPAPAARPEAAQPTDDEPADESPDSDPEDTDPGEVTDETLDETLDETGTTAKA
jgi:cell division septum initiation protein DivIVA